MFRHLWMRIVIFIGRIRQRFQKKTKTVASFVRERAIWIATGRPMRGPEERAAIFEICQSNVCGAFKGSSCGICGCGLHPTRDVLNKIAWATTSCPHKNKYWGPQSGLKLEGILAEPTAEIMAEAQQEISEQPKACGCKQ